jgi:hypothetical protein
MSACAPHRTSPAAGDHRRHWSLAGLGTVNRGRVVMKEIVVPKKAEKCEIKDTYRAPRLVTLGTTVRLVQGGCTSGSFDGTGGYRC